MDNLTLSNLVAQDATINDLRLGNNGLKSYIVTDTATVTATAAANTDLTVQQPANTTIKNLYVIPQGTFTTNGVSGDDLDIDVGTGETAGGGQIIDQKALLDDGGAAVTMAKGDVLAVINNFAGAASNAFVDIGPATSEAMTIVDGTLGTADARQINIRFTPLANDLAATSTVKVVVEFVGA